MFFLKKEQVSMNRPWFMSALGTTQEMMMDQPVTKWIGANNEPFLKDILQVYKFGKPIFSSEYEMKGGKGSTFVNYQVMPLITGNMGTTNGVVIVVDDISSEKKAVMTLGR
jgi:PAS domain-containing protein